MGRLFADTTQAVEDQLIAGLRQMSPPDKLRMVGQMNTAVIEMMAAGLRRQYPHESPAQLQRRITLALYAPFGAPDTPPKQAQGATMSSEPVEVMVTVARIFEELGIAYAVGGSMASAYYGVGRATFNVDFIADVHDENVSPLVAAFRSHFYVDESMIRGAIAQSGSFNLIHNATMFKVDVFIAGAREFDKQQLDRAAPTLVATDPPHQAYLLSAEDVVLAKLNWYRLSGRLSDRQWQDVLGVLVAQAGQLDINYMQQAATTLGVDDLLITASADSGYE